MNWKLSQILIFFFVFSVSIYSEKFDLVFLKYSYSNPWLPPEKYKSVHEGVRISESEVLFLAPSGQTPSHGEFTSNETTSLPLRVLAYDTESGLLLLQNRKLPSSIPITPFADEGCNLEKPQYAKLPFTKLILKLFPSKMKFEEPTPIFSKNQFCGFGISNWILGNSLIRQFYEFRSSFLGFPQIGFEFLERFTLAEQDYYFSKAEQGVVVERVFPSSRLMNQIFPEDVLLSIDGKNLNGQDPFTKRQKVYEWILESPKSVGVLLKLKRNGNIFSVRYKPFPYLERMNLIPDRKQNKIDYLLAGGMVFQELTSAYLTELGEEFRERSERRLLYFVDYFRDRIHPQRKKIVLMSRVLPVEENMSYANFQDLVLKSANGILIEDLVHFEKILTNLKQNEPIYLEFLGGKFSVFFKDELSKISARIENEYRLNR